MNLSFSQTAMMFNCSLSQLKNQYAENKKQFEKMYAKAVATGKKHCGYTAEQLKDLVDKYSILAEECPDLDKDNTLAEYFSSHIADENHINN